jgi:inosine/guanosine/xanthosine phosphorylase family protein
MGQKSQTPNKSAVFESAALGVLLGSGLAAVTEGFPAQATLKFDEIEGLTPASVAGHKGELRQCLVSNRPCLFICGRKHYYEGHAEEIRALMRYVHGAGLRELILTSAAGSLLKSVVPGELVLITDVMDAQFRSPVAERTSTSDRDQTSGARRTGEDDRERAGAADRPSSPRKLMIDEAASDARVGIGRGAAITCAGPAYETPAEIRALQEAGASVVTMSGAPEIEAANSLGMRVAMVAVVTNWAAGISSARLRHEDVLEVARSAAARLRQLIVKFVETH